MKMSALQLWEVERGYRHESTCRPRLVRPRNASRHTSIEWVPFHPLRSSNRPCRMSLTTPSRGHSTAGFAACWLPLMSNVKRRPVAERWRTPVNIEQFMQGYKAAWEQRDEKKFVALFPPDGQYHNTPFAVQRGSAELAQYWQRVKMQDDVHVAYEILADTVDSGIAHWHTTYQVASEELFQIWARSTGTNFVARKPGAPLPRMALDGILFAKFVRGLCSEARIWWHSMPQPS